MAVKCPNRNSSEWKEIISILENDRDAMKMYAWFENEENPEEKILQYLKRPAERKASLLKKSKGKIKKVNIIDSHGEEGHEYRDSEGNLIQSVSRALDNFPETRYRGSTEGFNYAKRGQEIHEIYEKMGKSVTSKGLTLNNEKNIKEFMQKAGIPASAYIDIKLFVEKLGKTGTVLSEIILFNDTGKEPIAGTADIVHLRDDGKIDIYDVKTAHATPAKLRQPDAKIWDPHQDHNGFKARRYAAQLEMYGKMVERTLQQPVSNKYVIPIEVSYNDAGNPDTGIANIKVLPPENTASYYNRARRIVDEFFGEIKKNPLGEIKIHDDADKFNIAVLGIPLPSHSVDLLREAKKIYTYRYTDKTGRTYVRAGAKPLYLKGKTESEHLQQIVRDVLEPREKNRADVADSITNYIHTGEDGFIDKEGPVGEMLRSMFKQFKGREDVEIIRVSDIKGLESKTDWIILKQDNDHQLFYITADNLIEKIHLDRDEKTIFANHYREDQAEVLLKSTLDNSMSSARALEATMIAMSLKKAIPDATFSRILLYSYYNQGAQKPIAVDLSHTIPTLVILAKKGKVQGLPESLISAANDSILSDYKSYKPNYLEMYTHYIQDYLNQRDKLSTSIEEFQKGSLKLKELKDEISREIFRLKDSSDENKDIKMEMLSTMWAQVNELPLSPNPISWLTKYVHMPQVIRDPIIGRITVLVKEAIRKVQRDFWEDYKKPMIKAQEKLFSDRSIVNKPLEWTISDTTKYYEPLMKKRKNVSVEVYKDGQRTVEKRDLMLFEFLDEDSVEFSKLPASHQNFITKTNDSIQKAAERTGVVWPRGRLPLMEGSVSNAIFKALKGDISTRQGYTTTINRLSAPFEDAVGSASVTDASDSLTLRNYFKSQADDTKWNALLGMKGDGVISMEEYARLETNVEVLTDMFVMNSIRVKEFNKLTPDFIAAENLYNMYKSKLYNDQLKHNEDWIRIYRIGVLENRDVDSGTAANKAIKIMNRWSSIQLIGFNPATALVAFTGQELTILSQAIANTWSEKSSFTVKEILKAFKFVTSLEGIQMMDALMKQNGMFNMDVTSFINGYRRYGNKSIFRTKNFFALLNAGDFLSRGHILMAQMIKDGSIKAYKLVDDELVYDEDKDPRWEGEDGKIKKEAVKADLANEGGLDENGRMLRGYNDKFANSMKAEADLLIGGFDRETRAMYSYFAGGKMMGLFRTWLPARLAKGFMSPQESQLIVDLEVEEIDGKKVPVWKGRQMEGIWFTLGTLWFNIKQFKRKIMNNEDGEQVLLTDVQKENLRRLTSDMIIVSNLTLIAIALRLADEDDKSFSASSSSLIVRSMQDLLAVYNMAELGSLLHTPIAIQLLERNFRVITNVFLDMDVDSNDFEKLMDIIPVLNRVQEAINLAE